MLQHSDIEPLKVLVKSMVTSLKQDLLDFAIARRACRKHIFKYATIMHEPRRLIDGPLWGPNLFPAALVKATVDSASAVNQNLKARWNLSYKKRSQENVGAPPRAGKKSRGNPQQRGGSSAQYRIPKRPPPQQPQTQQQPQYAVFQPVPSTSQAPQGQQLFVLQPTQSPAFHAPYEQASSSFGPHQSRGGGGFQRRGKGRGTPQARGRGNFQKRGRGRGNPSQ